METLNNWITLEDRQSGQLTVHEVKCPICKHHETFVNDNPPPSSCYTCGAVLKLPTPDFWQKCDDDAMFFDSWNRTRRIDFD